MPLPCTTAVIGAGCIGAAVGISIATKEAPVRFVGRSGSSAFKALMDKGEMTLQVNNNGRTIKVNGDVIEFATDPAVALKGVNLVLVATKRTLSVTKEVGETISKFVDQNATVLLLQNGFDAAKQLRDAFVVERSDLIIINVVVTFNVVDVNTGQYFLSTPIDTCSLALDGATHYEHAEAASKRIGHLFDTYADRDLIAIQAGKLLLNLINGPNALAGCDTYTMVMEAGYRNVWRASIQEARQVFEKAGIKQLRTPRDKDNGTLKKLPILLSLPTPLVKLVMWWTGNTPVRGGKSSLLQDMEKNAKETEIDVLTGKISSWGREIGVATPACDKIVELIKEACTKGLGSPKLSPTELQKVVLGY